MLTYRNDFIAWVLSVCFIALIPSVGVAGDVKTEMTALQAETGKLGAAKVQGSDLYFGDTKASSDIVVAVTSARSGVATLFRRDRLRQDLRCWV